MPTVLQPDGTEIEFDDDLSSDLMRDVSMRYSKIIGQKENYGFPRQNAVGQYQIGGQISIKDIFNQFYKPTQMTQEQGVELLQDVSPVWGDKRALERGFDMMSNPPNPMDYVQDGVFNERAYNLAMRNHGGEIGLELGSTAPAIGGLGYGAYRYSKHLMDNGGVPRMFDQSGMITYHGSPHKFSGQLDAEKIGTGEGAQAYGYGHYLAENPDIANYYRERLSPEQRITGKIVTPEGTIDWQDAILKYWSDGETDPRTMVKVLERIEKTKGRDSALEYIERNIVPEIRVNQGLPQEKWADFSMELTEKGNLYKYDLSDEAIDKMLDWDAPLSEQKGILDAMGGTADANRYVEIEDRLTELMNNGGLDSPEWEALVSEAGGIRQKLGYNPIYTGEQVYKDLVQKYHTVGAANPEQMAAKEMQSLGIPGIKYYDGGSRAAGEGTRNFVVFPGSEDIAKPLTRNDEPLVLLDELPMDEASRMQRAREKYKTGEKYHQKIPEVEYIDIDDIKKTEFGQIIEKPEDYDFSNPIEVSIFSNGELKISDGHHRLEAARALGIKRLPVILQAINAKGEDIARHIK